MPGGTFDYLRGATLVVRGVVDEVTPETIPYHDWLRAWHIEDAGGLTFKMIPIESPYTPPGGRITQARIDVGETWYVFLKKGDSAYYPFAGWNGLLKLVDTKLIYNNVVEYPRSKDRS